MNAKDILKKQWSKVTDRPFDGMTEKHLSYVIDAMEEYKTDALKNMESSSRIIDRLPTEIELYRKAKTAADQYSHNSDYANGYEAGYQSAVDYLLETIKDGL